MFRHGRVISTSACRIFRVFPMPRKDAPNNRDHPRPMFITSALWHHVIETLELSPQQARIVSMILQGKQDKFIAARLGLSRYTIRCYLRRIFDRQEIDDRMQLVLRIFAICAEAGAEAACSPYGQHPSG